MLTAVFSMRWVRGFEAQILEALKSADPEIHYEAIEAAGNWELDAAWPHLVALVQVARSPKPMLIAAIGAIASIRPEATRILVDLADSDDEEIAEAAEEAMGIAELRSDEEDEEDEEDVGGKWIN
jgi:HEAT repeat protein